VGRGKSGEERWGTEEEKEGKGRGEDRSHFLK